MNRHTDNTNQADLEFYMSAHSNALAQIDILNTQIVEYNNYINVLRRRTPVNTHRAQSNIFDNYNDQPTTRTRTNTNTNTNTNANTRNNSSSIFADRLRRSNSRVNLGLDLPERTLQRPLFSSLNDNLSSNNSHVYINGDPYRYEYVNLPQDTSTLPTLPTLPITPITPITQESSTSDENTNDTGSLLSTRDSMHNLFETFFSNVPIFPSNREIDCATILVTFGDIIEPLNSNCPITLDNFNADDEILQIRHCRHNFTPESLQNWFRSNVGCPVCRFDIRNYNSQTSPRSSTENQSNHVRSISTSDDDSENNTETSLPPSAYSPTTDSITRITELLIEQLAAGFRNSANANRDANANRVTTTVNNSTPTTINDNTFVYDNNTSTSSITFTNGNSNINSDIATLTVDSTNYTYDPSSNIISFNSRTNL